MLRLGGSSRNVANIVWQGSGKVGGEECGRDGRILGARGPGVGTIALAANVGELARASCAP